MAVSQKYRFPFASYPAVRLALLMALGITADYHLNPSTDTWLIIGGALGILYLSSERIYQRSLMPPAYNLAMYTYLGMVLGFGGIWHSFFDNRQPPQEALVVNAYRWEKLTFGGTVQQIRHSDTGKYQIDVDVDTTIFPENLGWNENYRLRAVADSGSKAGHLNQGDNITFSAIVYPLEEKRNPSEFDYKQYLASRGMYVHVGIQDIITVTSGDNFPGWTYFRNRTLKAIENNFSKEVSSLAKALLIGHKNELRHEEKVTFSRAGLSHIMAVSGLHVGFILVPFWIMIPLFWTLRYGKLTGLAAVICLLFFYAGLTGFSASVSRASLVGVLLTYGKLFHKVRNSINLTAVAALLILLVEPSDLFSIGFQLSFGAVTLIFLIVPVIQGLLPGWIRYRWFGKPVMVVILSLIIQVGLFPLLAYYFGEFSIIGPLVNAVVIPFLGLFVPYALFLVPVAIPFPGIAQYLNTPVDIFLITLNRLANVAACLSWSWISIHIHSILFFCIWIAAVFFIASLPIPKMRWRFFILFLIFLCLQQGVETLRRLQPAKLKITFFDVGQGDAAFVTTPRNKHILIDTGRWQPNYNSAAYVIIPYLKEQGIKKLDAVFLSHPHADHIGGIVELMQSIPVDTIYNSGISYDSQLYNAYHKKALQEQIPVKSLVAGDKIRIDSSIRIFVYGPMPPISEQNPNNHSLVFELIYGETEFLFMGDAEKTQEEYIVERYPELSNTDYLKISHHGSNTSSTSRFLKTVGAQTGITSVGKRNKFGHPHPEAVKRLRRSISKLYFTSLDGAVQLISDGKKIYRRF